MSDVITAVVGFAAVVAGAFLGAYASARASRRTQGRAAALLAAGGLESWTDAVDLLKRREPHYPRDETYDIFMALDLAAIREVLTTDWWETNQAGLVRIASDDQWAALKGAGKASRGMLGLLSSIGNVGEEVWMRRAEVLANRPSGSSSNRESDCGVPSRPWGDSDPDVIATEFEAKLADERKKLGETWRTLEAELAGAEHELRVTQAFLDYRLDLVRDVQRTMVSAGRKFDDAARVCHDLEKANRGPLGLLGAIRR